MQLKRSLRFLDKLVLPIEQVSRITYLKVTLGVVLLIALITHHPLDPSPLNLLVPANGVHNLLMLPGALIAGFLNESLGLSAYLIPLSLLLLARNEKRFKPLRVFPVALAIIAFTSWAALLIDGPTETVLQLTGIWGVGTQTTLVAFPGRVASLVLLSLYLILYYKEIRIDSTPILLISLLALVVLGILKQLKTLLTTTFQTLSKYFSINWLTPGISYIEKRLGGVYKAIQNQFMRLKTALLDTRQKKLERVGRKQNLPVSTPLQDLDDDEVLSRTILAYRKHFLVSDSRNFLVYEEEI